MVEQRRTGWNDITGSIVDSFPAQLPCAECGKGVLCSEPVLTFGESISSTSLTSIQKQAHRLPRRSKTVTVWSRVSQR